MSLHTFYQPPIHLEFGIPQNIHEELLPNPALSIPAFLRFHFPPSARGDSTSILVPKDSDFSETASEEISIEDLQQIPVPNGSFIDELLARGKDAVRSGAKSIKCANSSFKIQFLPLWVLTYWKVILAIKKEVREPWLLAEKSLQELSRRFNYGKNLMEARDTVRKVRNALENLTWTEELSGFDSNDSISTLSFYLTRKWLEDTHENQMLDLLRSKVHSLSYSDSNSGLPTEIVDVFFFTQLINVYEQRREDYEAEAKDLQWLYGWGQLLAFGAVKDIGGLYNSNGNHWVSIVIDVSQCRYLYGDSLSSKIDDRLAKAIKWWTHHHTKTHFRQEMLPITRQNDGYSCGLLAFNSLAHYFDKDLEPLIRAKETSLERLKVFLKVVSHHNAFAFHAKSKDFQFTFSVPSSPVLSSDATLLDNDIAQLPSDETQTPEVSFNTESESSLLKDEDLLTEDTDDFKLNQSSDDEDIFAPINHKHKSRTVILDSPSSSEDSDSEDRCIAEKITGKKCNRELKSISTPTTSPTKKKSKAVAQNSKLEDSEEHGLMKYMKPVTREVYNEQCKRLEEKMKEYFADHNEELKEIAEWKKDRKRVAARERQRKHRAMIQAENAVVSEAGKKRKIGNDISAIDFLRDSPSKRPKTLAEMTRPYRGFKRDVKSSKITVTEDDSKSDSEKGTKEEKQAIYKNWHTPLLWMQIEQAAKNPRVCKHMKAKEIKDILVHQNPLVFKHLSLSTLRGWIDYSKKPPQWSDRAIKMAQKGNKQGGQGGRIGLFAKFPEVASRLKESLDKLRENGVPLSVVTIRGIAVATILKLAPEMFQEQFKDGSLFRCSEGFLRAWLHKTLNWSECRATRAAGKLPKDWESICRKAIMRMAYTIREEEIPSELYVNTDQTQLVYAQGTNITWNESGAKQVSVLGKDEKRAFTLVVSVSNNGVLLPFQTIHQGQTFRSLPRKTAPLYDEAEAKGFRFEFSKTKTYWSTHETMHYLVEYIIAPYFEEMRIKLGLPEDQKFLWQIDVWSVHRSEEFREWMKKNYPRIIIHYVPANCTGVFQPCDVGIQRILKHSLKRSFHQDIVLDVSSQMDKGNDIVIENKLGVLRDRAVAWLVHAHNNINHVNIVKKAFETCRVGDWNLSYESLTSREVRQALKDLKRDDPDFWTELTGSDDGPEPVGEENDFADDYEGEVGDDCMIPTDVLIEHVCDGTNAEDLGLDSTEHGLVTYGLAESANDQQLLTSSEGKVVQDVEELGVGKRRIIPNRLYRKEAGFEKH